MFDSRIIEWVIASIVYEFRIMAEINNLDFFVEPQSRDAESDEFIEVRLDGPIIIGGSRNNFYLDFELNILIQINIGSNIYRIREIQGIICEKIISGIQIKKYGTNEENYGCLKQLYEETGGDNITVSNFGRIEPSSTIEQSSIESHLRFHIGG
jgi:hypothetical protein